MVNSIIFNITAIVLCVIAVLSIMYAVKKRVAKEEYDDMRTGRFREARLRMEAQSQVLTLQTDIKQLKKEYHHLLTTGCRNIVVKEYHHGGLNSVVVCGRDTINPSLEFEVKSFVYNDNDPDDYEFAKREAEELVDKLKS